MRIILIVGLIISLGIAGLVIRSDANSISQTRTEICTLDKVLITNYKRGLSGADPAKKIRLLEDIALIKASEACVVTTHK